MTKKTASIWFIILGFLIILISLKLKIIFSLIIGLIVIIQGVYTFFKNN